MTKMNNNNEWRPIETAPRDNTYYLLYNSVLGDFDIGYKDSTDDSWYDDMAYDLKPTHWMPLPSPPEEEEST